MNILKNEIYNTRRCEPFSEIEFFQRMNELSENYTKIGYSTTNVMVHLNKLYSMPIFFLLMTPMIIPVILIAIGTFYVFGKVGVVNSIPGLVLAHTVLAIPIVMIIMTSALRTYDLNQELVARSLGASRVRAFFQITLPQIKFSVIISALFAFLTSFDEVIISIFLSGGGNSTLTKQMFNALRDYIDPTIAAISTLMIILSTILMLGAQYLGREK